jgi:putative resolvase
MARMKLSVWAELQGISYKTAWRMWKAKTLPIAAHQLPTGTVVVEY